MHIMVAKNLAIIEYFGQIRKRIINVGVGVQKFCLARALRIFSN
jgi:hypothetical protein